MPSQHTTQAIPRPHTSGAALALTLGGVLLASSMAWACPPGKAHHAKNTPANHAGAMPIGAWPWQALPGGFAVQAPPGTQPVLMQGKDSTVSRLVHADMTLEVDLGAYANPLTPESPSVHAKPPEAISINGIPGKLVHVKAGVVGLHLPKVPTADGADALPLKLTLQCLAPTPKGLSTCDKVLRSLKYTARIL